MPVHRSFPGLSLSSPVRWRSCAQQALYPIPDTPDNSTTHLSLPPSTQVCYPPRPLTQAGKESRRQRRGGQGEDGGEWKAKGYVCGTRMVEAERGRTSLPRAVVDSEASAYAGLTIRLSPEQISMAFSAMPRKWM